MLLICAVLDDDRLRTFFQLADSLGLSALVEAHDEDEVRRAIAIGAASSASITATSRTYGIPRYELPPAAAGTEGHPLRRRKRHQDGRPHEGPARPRVDAVLIGETFMRSPDKKAMLDELAGGYRG